LRAGRRQESRVTSVADETLRLIIEALDKNAEKTIKGVKDELAGVKDKTKESSEGIGDFVESLTGISPASLTVGAALTAVGMALKWSLDQAAEAEVAQAKLEAVLHATGNAAGMSVGQLNDLANEVSRLSGLDDELVLNAEAVLLTFRNINQDVFPQTIKLAADMAAVMGMDLQSAVVMLGKAMNDPAQGMSALQRVGVSFTEDQKEMAKAAQETGDMLAAQGVILRELSVEFGGAAEAMGNTAAGSADKLNVSFGNLGAAITSSLLPAQRDANIALIEFIDTLTAGIEETNKFGGAQRQAVDEMIASGEMSGRNREEYVRHREEIEANTNEIIRWTEYGEAWERMLAQGTTTITEQTSAVQTYTEYLDGIEVSYDKVLNMAMRLQTENDKFAERTTNLTEKQAELKQEIDALIAQGWSPYGDKVQELQGKYNDIGAQITQVADQHQQAVYRMIYDLQVQKMSADGVTEAEYEMIIRLGEGMGLLDKKTADQALAVDKLTTAVKDGKLEVGNLKSAIDMLPSGKSIDVILKILNNFGGSAMNAPSGSRGSSNANTPQMQDAGGEGEAGGMYIITPTAAPEGFIPSTSGTFVPNIDRYMGGGGGSVVMNVTIATPINLASEDDVLRALTPLVEQIADRRR
jgi:hypothetical protein